MSNQAHDFFPNLPTDDDAALLDWFTGQALAGIMANPERWKQIALDYATKKKTYEECSMANAVKARSIAWCVMKERQRERRELAAADLPNKGTKSDAKIFVKRLGALTEDLSNLTHELGVSRFSAASAALDKAYAQVDGVIQQLEQVAQARRKK